MKRTYSVEDYRRDLARLDGLRQSEAPGLSSLLAERLIADAESVPEESGPRRRETPPQGFAVTRPTIPSGPAALRAAGLGERPRGRLRCSAWAVLFAVLAAVLGGGTGCQVYEPPGHGNLPAGPAPLVLVPADDELAALLTAADAEWEAVGVQADRVVIAEPGAEGEGLPRAVVDVERDHGQVRAGRTRDRVLRSLARRVARGVRRCAGSVADHRAPRARPRPATRRGVVAR